ncbi:MAG TPA: penicillin-binding protein 1C [Polyangiaceae bacterium]|jgi:penicillin-binding protein 1C
MRAPVWLRTRPSLRQVGAAALVAPVLGVVAIIVASFCTSLPPELLVAPSPSVRVEDSAGTLLREVRANDGKRARVLTEAELGPTAVHALLAAEDLRFYGHPGVDPLAVLRAAFDSLRHGHVVSGASTLTMQLARTIRPHRRTLFGKLQEMALALRIERALPKSRILELYASEVDFGPQVRGFGAASRAVFGKSPRALSIAEAALVAGLPRGPSLYALGKRTALVRARRDRILARMAGAGWITEDERQEALAEPIHLDPERAGFSAPHFVAGVVGGGLAPLQPGLKEALSGGEVSVLETTLDGSLQRAAERATAATVDSLRDRHVTAGAVVVLDNATGDVLAYVGSPDPSDVGALGGNDGARALRQPGSTLKPLLYALALERLGFTAATVLPDVPLRIDGTPGQSDFAPRDYDGHFHGPVRLREALASSLNVPAVWTLAQIGVAPFLDRLHALGFASLNRPAEDYGTALALGDGEVSFLELANAYAALARGGRYRPLRFVRAVTRGPYRRELEPAPSTVVFPESVADQIIDVLKDPRARVASFGEGDSLRFPFDVAAKTGTSKGYRDNWTVGFSHAVTVAAWVGNFDGTPMDRVSGITGAGPLFHAVMTAAMQGREAAPLPIVEASRRDRADEAMVRVSVCALSGELPGHDCPHRVAEWMPRARAQALSTCSMHVRVAVDRRNGLRAGPGCDPSAVEEVPFEVLPTEYDTWTERSGHPAPPRAYSPLCPGPPDEGPVHIDAPRDGDAFVLDPDHPVDLQAIDVRVAAPAGSREVTVTVDGAPAATLAPPFVFAWHLSRGEHVLTARAGDDEASPPVRVRVQ